MPLFASSALHGTARSTRTRQHFILQCLAPKPEHVIFRSTRCLELLRPAAFLRPRPKGWEGVPYVFSSRPAPPRKNWGWLAGHQARLLTVARLYEDCDPHQPHIWNKNAIVSQSVPHVWMCGLMDSWIDIFILFRAFSVDFYVRNYPNPQRGIVSALSPGELLQFWPPGRP